MNRIKCLLLFFLFTLIISCGKEKNEISKIKETRQDLEIMTTYREAHKALEQNDPYFAAKKFPFTCKIIMLRLL